MRDEGAGERQHLPVVNEGGDFALQGAAEEKCVRGGRGAAGKPRGANGEHSGESGSEEVCVGTG